ncbi:MAG: ABC transporter permease [Ancalomicrobiaceae bacterium]|nr:ABC transporter permease [Ancalomicrobiaceae bacterium]
MSQFSSSPESGAVHAGAATRLRGLLLRWETALVLLLAAAIAVNSVISPYFLDIYNLSDATTNFSEQAIVALPMTLLILVGEIDLSVAAIIAVVSLAIGVCSDQGMAPYGLMLVGLAVGALCGAFNGALVAGLRLPSIVVTIGTMSLFRGIAQVALGDQAITNYAPEFQSFGQGYVVSWPPVPNSFALFLGLALVFGVVLHRTRYGRALYAIGNNAVAARFSGLNVARTRFVLFVMSGLLCGLASVLLTARIGSTRPNIATGWELSIVTMVVLGGVSFEGGKGTIPGVVLAIFILGTITWGLSLVNFAGIEISVVIGAILIVTIAAPLVLKRLARRFASGSS